MAESRRALLQHILAQCRRRARCPRAEARDADRRRSTTSQPRPSRASATGLSSLFRRKKSARENSKSGDAAAAQRDGSAGAAGRVRRARPIAPPGRGGTTADSDAARDHCWTEGVAGYGIEMQGNFSYTYKDTYEVFDWCTWDTSPKDGDGSDERKR